MIKHFLKFSDMSSLLWKNLIKKLDSDSVTLPQSYMDECQSYFSKMGVGKELKPRFRTGAFALSCMVLLLLLFMIIFII